MEAFGGGVFTYICNLANILCNDFDIYVAYGIRKQTPNNFEKYFDKRINLIYVKNYQREVSLQKDIAAFKEMKEIVNSVKPDIVHLNSSKSGILGRLLLKNSKIPTFYTPHGYSFLMTNISPKKKIVYKYFEKIFAFKNITTIACSFSEYKITKDLTSNCTYVDNGINLNEFNNIELRPYNNNLVIATLGRISFQKNPKLFNKIAEYFPNNRFVWIGDGNLKDELSAPNIEITGWVDNQDALKYLNKADIFVLTSLWEGLPMALLEAMYMKRLCIVSDVVGNKDVIVNKKNGFLCDTIDDFKTVMSEVIEKGIDDNITLKAQQDIKTHYNSKIMANEYKKIYLNSLKNNKLKNNN